MTNIQPRFVRAQMIGWVLLTGSDYFMEWTRPSRCKQAERSLQPYLFSWIARISFDQFYAVLTELDRSLLAGVFTEVRRQMFDERNVRQLRATSPRTQAARLRGILRSGDGRRAWNKAA